VASITFSGLGSGIDTASIISKLMEVERLPVTKLESRQAAYKSQLSIVRDLNSRLQALQTAAKGVATADDFTEYRVESDDEGVTATATGRTSPGVYDVEVVQLAAAERTYSDGFAASDEAGVAGVGTLTIKVGADDEVEIEVTAADTLQTIASKINSSTARVTAGILATGDEFRLQINGKETGAENAITFGAAGTVDLGLDDPLNEYRAARDAEIIVDGFEVSSGTNTVADAIPGVALELKAATSGPAEITVAADAEGMVEGVEAFITAYNRVLSLISTEFTFSGEAKGDDRLAGDATLRSIQRQLGGAISAEIEELGGSLKALSQIGISTQRDGTLELDADELREALADRLDDVAELFGGRDGGAGGVADLIGDTVKGFIDFSDGVLTAKEDGIEENMARIDDQIAAYELRLQSMEERLIMQFTEMDLMVSSLSSQMSYLSNIYQDL